MTVEEFLDQHSFMKALRAELTHRVGAGDMSRAGPGRRGCRINREIADYEAKLRSLWNQGLEGWLTADEGRSVAATLTSEATAAGILAHARIELDDRSDAWIVFHGSKARWGATHRLSLRASSPVRVRAHWDVFIEFCPRGAARA